jgi:hypothetical protein
VHDRLDNLRKLSGILLDVGFNLERPDRSSTSTRRTTSASPRLSTYAVLAAESRLAVPTDVATEKGLT